MTITLDNLADSLQTLFTTTADQAAKDSGMIQRQRHDHRRRFCSDLGLRLA